MEDSVLDVLMYLFDHYVADTCDLESDQETLKSSLLQAGFADDQIIQALEWLRDLEECRGTGTDGVLAGDRAFRVFNDEESRKLDSECRGFMLLLEQSGILNAQDRELVMDRVMALSSEEIELAELKWIILVVLLNRTGYESEFNWKEDFVMDEIRPDLH